MQKFCPVQASHRLADTARPLQLIYQANELQLLQRQGITHKIVAVNRC